MYRLHEKEKTELRRLLARAGYTQVEDILIILDAFLDTERHQTVAELGEYLKKRGSNYDPGFIKNALDIFSRYGFAQMTALNGREPSYEHHHLGHHHDHLVCTRCGHIEEFINPEMEKLQTDIARRKGFVPLKHRMEIYGLCSNCLRQRGQAIPLTQAEQGEKAIILGHEGGDELNRRLADMGLTPGTEIEILSRNEGPLVVSCRNSRLALGQGMGDKIMVAPVKNRAADSSTRRGRRKWRFSAFRRGRGH